MCVAILTAITNPDAHNLQESVKHVPGNAVNNEYFITSRLLCATLHSSPAQTYYDLQSTVKRQKGLLNVHKFHLELKQHPFLSELLSTVSLYVCMGRTHPQTPNFRLLRPVSFCLFREKLLFL